MLNGHGVISATCDEQATRICDPCKFYGRKLPAKGFCKTCDGHMCKDCLKVHKSSLDTHSHVIISEAKYAATNSFDSVQRCDEHQTVLESYCSDHDQLCCHECIATRHRACSALIPIQRASSGIRDGKTAQKITSELETLLSQFMRLKKDEENEMKNINKQGDNLEKMVKDFRKEVNEMLDRAESALYRKRDELCKLESKELFERYKTCENTIPVLTKAVKLNENKNKQTNDQRLFIVTKKSQSVVQKYKPVLQDLMERRSAFTVKFLPNEDLKTAIESIGSIFVRATEHFVGINDEPPSESQETNGTIRLLMQSGKVNVKGNSDKNTCTITGCAFLQDSRIILADETNKTLKLIGLDNRITHCYKLKSAPWDIVALPDNLVAIRCSFSDNDKDDNAIQILFISNEIKPLKCFRVEGRPRAIDYSHPFMYIACSDKKSSHIIVVDETYEVVKHIRPKEGVLRQPQYMSVDNKTGKVYVSDYYNGVIVLNPDGEVVSKLKDSNLTEFGGITIDASGDVYLCAGLPYGVYKLSKTGDSVTALATWDEGTIDPQTVAYNVKSDNFIVTSCSSDKAYFFSYIDTLKDSYK